MFNDSLTLFIFSFDFAMLNEFHCIAEDVDDDLAYTYDIAEER